jgi:hypothetical protein
MRPREFEAVIQIEMRVMQTPLHQIFYKFGVACACSSSPCVWECVEAQVEPVGAPPHHPPIPLVLLHHLHYSRLSRSLLPVSQKNLLLLVQSAF